MEPMRPESLAGKHGLAVSLDGVETPIGHPAAMAHASSGDRPPSVG